MALKTCKDIKSIKEEIHLKKLEIMKLKNKQYFEVTVGFVPTMGYLHQGHISLVEKAKSMNDIVVASIFINPTQFNANEDLSTYPVDLESDSKLLNQAETDLLFLPTPDIVYPKGFSTYVQVESMSDVLESKSRPGHFRGVATVVTKLLLIVNPSNLYIGQKDAMQCICISRLVQDLNIDTNVHICDTIRENTGLAKSSRNSYLSQDEQQQASKIYQILTDFKNRISSFNDRNHFIDEITKLLESNPNVKVEYVSLASHENGLEILDQFPPPPKSNLSIALFFNGLKRKTRLIDVIIL
ncbi:hypothetical protein DICPUDRAFT_153918 [Dictyostelium purpureum]|uniref:Pantoate--beta-alanine ligase n=1 Tax=Dictyostelium purpureum TaxID=5786 RepID=F0ZQ30_DICPU|nr:uncharacterized protein DICPUDRAFT_153918 [Dictyostelium purpureum]EGC33938.1 hypothetical protein DICPUDRAFT_153918 [Dictyostelium purpureum]|eukprot:XP_003289520.1 hypothetical protein DICPUDRAFT_153918 [Dictyostelium purpureum]